MRILVAFSVICLFPGGPLAAQGISNEEIGKRIATYKQDLRGPYKEIRWYCRDGTILPPQERCPEPGGVQRARHKDEVASLALSNHVFLGQILATTPYPDFWDTASSHSRLKQYQLEKYLRAIDNGWVLRRAQFYRGAFQAEDESSWGAGFYRWLLEDDRKVTENFFLIRQSMKDVPHLGDDNLKQEIRAVSKMISDTYPPFLDLRVKIHGQPEEADLKNVQAFLEKHRQQLNEEQLEQFGKLTGDLKILYSPVDLSLLNKYLDQLPAGSKLGNRLKEGLNNYKSFETKLGKCRSLSGILYAIREQLLTLQLPDERMAVLELSLSLEKLLTRELSGTVMKDMGETLEYMAMLGRAATGCGYLEMWEWEELAERVRPPEGDQISLEAATAYFEAGRKITEWGVGMFMAHYEEVSDLYGGFEPLAAGFLDDQVRSSLLLDCGRTVDRLGDRISEFRPASNRVMDLSGQHAIRGLNPGYAAGELVVVSGQPGEVVVDREKIYVFNKPPSDLKPVAGIATVSEGNLVSHVQLLARNLGIPNAVLSLQNLEDLKSFSGKRVFYAVSPGGAVVLKPIEEITPEEKELIESRKRSEEKIRVPVYHIDLETDHVVSLSTVAAGSSGVLCGPKAANLGQLKRMFPGHVVNGLVIPFGVFRMHLDQPMPGEQVSYWQYLNGLFETATRMREEGTGSGEVEAYLLKELERFRASIRQINLMDGFLSELNRGFLDEFGKEPGKQPVFLRSDTNMEDLKEFTGAGLNLTLFNVVAEEAILQGIREVWASPYTERSYRWRQQYLLNPENVYPSILIIPSVDVDYSGVMVTRGISNQDARDITIAFSLGAGGAVEGQMAESYLLRNDGSRLLLSPAREPSYIRLPESGGSEKHMATFYKPLLNENNLRALRTMAAQIREELPSAPGIETSGPFDVELGFRDDHLWLFQVRPFVENKNAAASVYLQSLNPVYDNQVRIPLR